MSQKSARPKNSDIHSWKKLSQLISLRNISALYHPYIFLLVSIA